MTFFETATDEELDQVQPEPTPEPTKPDPWADYGDDAERW
jgi:hypothetical protein